MHWVAGAGLDTLAEPAQGMHGIAAVDLDTLAAVAGYALGCLAMHKVAGAGLDTLVELERRCKGVSSQARGEAVEASLHMLLYKMFSLCSASRHTQSKWRP